MNKNTNKMNVICVIDTSINICAYMKVQNMYNSINSCAPTKRKKMSLI